jgi:O-antigen ligase
LTLPVSLALASVIFADKSGLKSAATAILLLVSVGLLMTGERINGLIFMSSCALVLVFSKPNVRTVTLACTFCLIILATVILINPVFLIKLKQLLQISFSSDNSNYHELIQNGWLIFLDNIWLGIGTANFRPLCPELVPMELLSGCNNHPHNYYVQVLAEVGLLGFFAFSLMYILLIKSCWESRHVENAFAKTAFIIPLAFFFPIQTSADLFSQWNNSVMWTALALALSAHKIGEMTAK